MEVFGAKVGPAVSAADELGAADGVELGVIVTCTVGLDETRPVLGLSLDPMDGRALGNELATASVRVVLGLLLGTADKVEGAEFKSEGLRLGMKIGGDDLIAVGGVLGTFVG